MTDKEKLESMIRDGFRTHMILRDKLSEAELAKLPSEFRGRDVHALPYGIRTAAN